MCKVRYREGVMFVAGMLLATIRVLAAQPFTTEKIAVGAIFDQNTEEIQNVFKLAMTAHNQNSSSRGRYELQAYVDVINTADAFKLSRLICNQFARGVWSMLGAVSPDSFDTLHSYTNTFQMPFVTPSFPVKVIPPSSGLIDHAISLKPDYHKAVVDVIMHYGWKEVIYIYDSNDGLLRLQQLFQLLEPGKKLFEIIIAKRINNESDAMDTLLALERRDRWGKKRIVLDCSAKTAKSILVGHVRNVNIGRRTYHYMLSGLVMDENWEEDVLEYGAVNITGFRIIDYSRKTVQDFMEGLRRINPAAKKISAQAAFMYDGVQVLTDALGRLWRKKPDAFRNALRRATVQTNSTKVIDCNPGKGWVVPFEHGDKISRLIKKSDIEGLTGNISFNDEGHRHNYTLQVVEMTVQSALVKVATWSDKHGLKIAPHPIIPLNSPGTINTTKTYIVTTIIQEPYMMQKSIEHGPIKSEHFYGFCKDLWDNIARDLGIKYEIRLVKDSKYGNEVAQGHWNGLVGELANESADIAVAPLAILSEREKIVDFTEPFVSFNYAMKRRTTMKASESFSFLRPLSKEIWLCVVFSFFAVSVVLFLVSRFSPREWRSVSISDTQLEQPLATTNDIILHNEFSIWNSFWFSVGSFMQQGSDVVPKSLSGRIVGMVWWFFAWILVCSYTANLAAYIVVERIAETSNTLSLPLTALQSIDKQPPAKKYDPLLDDPVLTSDDLRHLHYAVDENGQLACNMLSQTCQIKQVDFAFATTKGSNLREAISFAINNIKTSGTMTKLLKRWLLKKDQPDCLLKKNEENAVSEMTLSQVSGVFYVLVGGLVVALCVAFLEFCQHGRSEAARSNLPLHAALRAKARMAARTERKSAQHTPTNHRDRLGWNGAPFPGYYASNQLSQEEALQASFTHV